MTKFKTVLVAIAALTAPTAVFSTYGLDAARSGRLQVGHRASAASDLQQFCSAWGLSRRQAVEVLVYIRSWIHDLLIVRHLPDAGLQPGDAEVLLAYARWLDGIPKVVQALPDAVAEERPVLMNLAPPACLPDEVQALLEGRPEAAPAIPPQQWQDPVDPASDGADVAEAPRRHTPSNPERMFAETRRFGFADRVMPGSRSSPKNGGRSATPAR